MILITGITGLTGNFLLKKFIENNGSCEIRCLVRETSNVETLKENDIEYIFGDVTNENDLYNAMDGVECVIHLVNIRSTPQVINACKRRKINRLIIVSTTGIYSKFNQYSKEYIAFEKLITDSGLMYTIIRPTMIYGNNQDKNIKRLIKIAMKTPIFPMIGDGKNLFQPIYADDLASVIYKCCYNDISIYKKYDVSGLKPIKYKEMIELIYSNLRKKVIFINIPYFIAGAVGKVCDYIPFIFLDSEKINRLKENKNYNHDLAEKELDFYPISFSDGIKKEITSILKLDNI